MWVGGSRKWGILNDRKPWDERHHRAYASLFGNFQLRTADGHEILISNRRAKAILALLCLEPGEPIERDFLSKLLWPGRFGTHAKASLRQCLLDLGKLLQPVGRDILQATRGRISLDPFAIRTDLGELERALQIGEYRAACEQLAAIGGAPLVDQMDFGDAFGDWLASYRATVERRLKLAVDAALITLEQEGMRNDQARLLDIWSVRDPPARQMKSAGRSGIKARIAVLPFRSLDLNPAQGYFADGIVDELITTLGQVPQLQVAGRTSSFHFRDSELALPEIASALRVTHLVEGSVQRQGRSGAHPHSSGWTARQAFESWGDRYDGTLSAIFQLQECVAQAVTGALADALGFALVAPLVRTMTHSRAAYDLYLQGKALSFKMFGDGALDTAVNLVEQAVALDSDFAEAWLLLAEVHQLIAIYTACLDRPAEAARMASCVERALAINPHLGQAYSLLGFHQMVNNEFVGALDLAFKGYRMEPTNPQVAMRLGSYLMFCGRTEDGMRYVEEALSQDPIDGRKYMLRGSGQFNRGNVDAAILDHQRSVDLGFASIYLAAATASAGQHVLAVEQIYANSIAAQQIAVSARRDDADEN